MRRKKFTVGLWKNIITAEGNTELQIWNISEGKTESPKLEWSTVVLANDEEEALELGQIKYVEFLSPNAEAEAEAEAA